MPSEKEIVIIQKATIYDIINIIEEKPEKTYTKEKIKRILKAYIAGAEQ